MMECRVLVINEETEEVMKNERIDEEFAQSIVDMIDCGDDNESCECGGCEEVCNWVGGMLEEAGIDECDHEEMLEALEGMRLVKKESGNGNGGKKVVKVVKKEKVVKGNGGKENGNGGKKVVKVVKNGGKKVVKNGGKKV